MRFEPKSEAEVSSGGLWPAGEYDFEVNEAEEQTSKSGNEMVKLTLHVFNADGQRRTVWDYLVSTSGGMFKIRHFAEATGMLHRYEQGDMPAEIMIGKTGRCKLAIVKDKNGQYPDKNGIADYLAARKQETRKPAQRQMATAGRDLDDEIPF